MNPRTIRPSAVIAITESPNPPAKMKTRPPALQSRSAQVIFRQFRNLSIPNHLFFERLS
jgi:hypothetical protein